MRNNLSQYKNIFRYVYSNIFPGIYCSTEQGGFDFKNPQHNEGMRNEISPYKQKPVKIDDFNNAEEKEIKKQIEKIKLKREVLKIRNFF